MKKTQCKRGHDVTSPDSRYKSRVCKACKAEDSGKPEVKAKAKITNRICHLRKYGWTLEMFEQTILEQGNVCALCRKPFTEKDPACPDHKHSDPPEPRGVLHSTCNAGIGLFKDDPKALQEAVVYMEAWV